MSYYDMNNEEHRLAHGWLIVGLLACFWIGAFGGVYFGVSPFWAPSPGGLSRFWFAFWVSAPLGFFGCIPYMALRGILDHRKAQAATASMAPTSATAAAQEVAQQELTPKPPEGFKGLNELCLGADGSIFFTDQGQTGLHDPTGRVYRLRPDGRLDLLIGTVPSPNGIVVAPDLSHVLVAVTRANQVWRLPLHGDGAVTKAGVFLHLHGGPGGPDGLAWDPEGKLLVAHTGVGTVWRVNARAEPTLAIASCAGASTTNLCLGGPDGRDVFITESETGSVLRACLESV